MAQDPLSNKRKRITSRKVPPVKPKKFDVIGNQILHIPDIEGPRTNEERVSGLKILQQKCSREILDRTEQGYLKLLLDIVQFLKGTPSPTTNINVVQAAKVDQLTNKQLEEMVKDYLKQNDVDM
jgi:hypothetical protein